MTHSLDHLHEAVWAARERWPRQEYTVTIGRREALAIREELVRWGQVHARDRALVQITHFLGCRVALRDVEHGVWVEPVGGSGDRMPVAEEP